MLSIEERELAIRWHQEGKKQQQIASLLGCHQTSISRLLEKYRRQNTVNDLSRSGRPTRLTPERFEHLKEVLTKKIRDKNANYGSLSTKEIRNIIHEEIGELYSMRHIERLMHKLGFSLITPRSTHIRHDPEAAEQFRKEFKKNSTRSMWTVKSLQSMK